MSKSRSEQKESDIKNSRDEFIARMKKMNEIFNKYKKNIGFSDWFSQAVEEQFEQWQKGVYLNREVIARIEEAVNVQGAGENKQYRDFKIEMETQIRGIKTSPFYENNIQPKEDKLMSVRQLISDFRSMSSLINPELHASVAKEISQQYAKVINILSSSAPYDKRIIEASKLCSFPAFKSSSFDSDEVRGEFEKIAHYFRSRGQLSPVHELIKNFNVMLSSIGGKNQDMTEAQVLACNGSLTSTSDFEIKMQVVAGLLSKLNKDDFSKQPGKEAFEEATAAVQKHLMRKLDIMLDSVAKNKEVVAEYIQQAIFSLSSIKDYKKSMEIVATLISNVKASDLDVEAQAEFKNVSVLLQPFGSNRQTEEKKLESQVQKKEKDTELKSQTAEKENDHIQELLSRFNLLLGNINSKLGHDKAAGVRMGVQACIDALKDRGVSFEDKITFINDALFPNLKSTHFSFDATYNLLKQDLAVTVAEFKSNMRESTDKKEPDGEYKSPGLGKGSSSA